MENESSSLKEDQKLKILERRAFDICLAIYRLTKLFPAGEILVSQLREASSAIIVSLATKRFRDTILKVEEVKIYLYVARAQDWLRPINFDLLLNAYELLVLALSEQKTQNFILEQKEKGMTPPIEKNFVPPVANLKNKKEVKKALEPDLRSRDSVIRQKKLIEYFNNKKQAKASELKELVEGVSERTIRNDLTELIEKHFIKRVGRRRNAGYVLASGMPDS